MCYGYLLQICMGYFCKRQKLQLLMHFKKWYMDQVTNQIKYG